MLSKILIAGIHAPSPSCPDQRPRPNDEFVVLVNDGEGPIGLTGCSLTNRKRDGVDHYRYIFPRFLSNGDPWEVEPGGLVFVYTGRGTNGATATTGEAHQIHLFQHRETTVWADPGDTACLYDRSGHLIATWELPGVRRAV